MKTYNEFITENQIDNEEWKEIAAEIDALWTKKSKGGRSNLSLGALGGTSIVGGFFVGGEDRREHANGILQNDPLNVRLYITQTRDGAFQCEISNKSIYINPDSQYMVYGSHKFKLRKIKAKNRADLIKKIEKNIIDRIITDIKSLLKDGQFEVYANQKLDAGFTTLEMIQKRFK